MIINCKYCGAKAVEISYDQRYAENITTGVQVRPIPHEKCCSKCGAYHNPVNRSLEGLTVEGKKVVKKW
jgi:hypothetical protein